MSDDGLSIMIVERWWGILPLIERLVSICGDRPVETVFNLNDEGVAEGLTFCDNRPSFSLIPDCVFIGTKGYHEQRELYAARAIAWDDKCDVVFWRGTSTGRPSGERHELPRISLCRLCQSDPSGLYDVGLTGLVDHGADETGERQSRSLLSGFVPWQDFDRYRYHIDIDGHTNSWPGLMFKLHSGGLVFKVDPPAGHRQWYYERLRPWENYVPVKSDLSDLFDLVAYFRNNDPVGRAIAEEGRRLAQSMEFASELDIGVRTILGRCAREQYVSSRL
ncbi:glycosyl transferase family 90 [Methylobacterium haplocladii]|nr:glycosyl transferase family 90 [Methylobacterium haplocladii]